MQTPEDLEPWSFVDSTGSLTVYKLERRGARRALLMHELPGLSEDCVDFARRLYGEGFEVHVPLLFGSLGQSSLLRGSYQMWCMRKQFELFRNNRSSPIADLLRRLCERLAADSGPVGVIGMCATGGLVMSLMYSPSVAAAVAAQPAMPIRLFYTRKAEQNLGASAQEVKLSAASGTPLLGLRFTWDPLCPANRLRQLRETFGERYQEHVASGNGLRHATLTEDAATSADAVSRTVAFLRDHVGDESSPKET